MTLAMRSLLHVTATGREKGEKLGYPTERTF